MRATYPLTTPLVGATVCVSSQSTKEGTMTPGMRNYLSSLSSCDRLKMLRDSQEALRLAWPHRDGLRGRIVVQSSVNMLRNLRSL